MVAKLLFELLQREAGADEPGRTTSHILPRAIGHTFFGHSAVSSETETSLAQRGQSMGVAFLMQDNVKAEINLAMKTTCSFHNPTLFFSPQRSQDGPIAKWLRELRGRNRDQGAGVDDADEDMALTTSNDRGVASSLGCGATIIAACGRDLAAQLEAHTWRWPELPVVSFSFV